MMTDRSDRPGAGASDAPQCANQRVLVVDDQPEIHDDFVDMLTAGGATRASDELAMAFASGPQRAAQVEEYLLPDLELSHAYSGKDACRQIEEAWHSERPFALAFVDVRMSPGIDGIEAVQRIRETDRDIEIVIMTAYTDRTRADIVRGTELLHKMLYLRKPFSREEIQQIAVSLVGKWNVERALADRSREIAASNKTLEAVLDSTEDAMVMFDVSGRVAFANSTFERLSGLRERELTAMPSRAVAGKLRERFREPSVADVEAGFVATGTSGLVEEVAPEGGGLGLFYRSTMTVTEGTEKIGRLEVYRNVSKDIEVQRMKAEVMRLRGELEKTQSFGEMVGGSRRMREVYGLIRQAAASDVTVLIRGETGTGKELVARSFHENSARVEGPFLAINCATIPEGLIESELFGHRKGSFTGATAERRGAFERARDGTLFLDEIADMRPDLQAKLLRVLQEREFQRVGGTRLRKANVRVIAATNRNLEQAVGEGGFRQDLFYRLSAFPVTIPPLRERREDIPLLARHFLKRRARRAGTEIGGISTAAMRLLLQYDWPGNVRELSNAIRRAVLLETTDVIQAGSLPRRLTAAVERGDADRRRPPGLRTLAAVERETLVDALEVSEGNISTAARGLGVSRATLYRKLRKHGLRT